MMVGSALIEKAGHRISVMSGDDFTTLPLWSIGGTGIISVVANCAPKLMSSLYDAWAAGDRDLALRLHYKMQPLARSMFVETNPIPVKWAVHHLGKCDDEIRMPMTVLSEPYRAAVASALAVATR